MIESVFGREKDLFFMNEALIEAHKAQALDEVPIGAVVVDSAGEIIGRGYNLVEKNCTQGAHAEVIALQEAGKAVGDWRLNGCWVYITLEPCKMCFELITLSRLSGMVYGAHSPLFGFHLDKTANLSVYQRDAFSIVEGVRGSESADLLRMFFRKKRKNNE